MAYLNTLSPMHARKDKKRVGRGIGSGKGKTCGRGHKGQKARAGGFHKVGFEGGQMPLQRRLPKYGFTSRKQNSVEQLRSSVLNDIDAEYITLNLLREMGIISTKIRSVKVFYHGDITKAVKLKGIRVANSVKTMIEKMGGSVA